MDYLIEIGTEEIPARFLTGLMANLKSSLSDVCQRHRIAFTSITALGTCRRLACIIEGIAGSQADVNREIKGPPVSMALGKDGEYTQAAHGFLRKNNVANGVIREGYLYASFFEKGKATQDLLGNILEEVLKGLYLPVSMKWGRETQPFVRPVHWIVSLMDDSVIELSFAGQKADRYTYGHRFLSGSATLDGNRVLLSSAQDYIASLRQNSVLVCADERRDVLVRSAQELVPGLTPETDLLEEVVNLVEYPTPLIGCFGADFLSIPERILVTTMQKHQKYFPLYEKGRLTHRFLIIADNVTATNASHIIRGNERVLRARLCDARFYYTEDLKHDFDFYLDKLRTITFQQQLGSIADKNDRNLRLAAVIADMAGLPADERERTLTITKLQKADLATGMVFEFPELQGYVGQQYALAWGLDASVANGISEHYKPAYSGDRLPADLASCVASVCDKLDTVCGHFAIGHIPTGSNDPYALRRQANGIVQILFETPRLGLPIEPLLETALRGLPVKTELSIVHSQLSDFFLARIENLLKERGLPADSIKAISTLNIPLLKKRVEFLEQLKASNNFKLIVSAAVRVSNISDPVQTTHEVNTALFSEPVEHSLWELISPLQNELAQPWEVSLLTHLEKVSLALETYFKEVMVMSEDSETRTNRINTMKAFDTAFRQIAQFKML